MAITQKSNATKFKETEVGTIPEGWDVLNVGKIGKVITGKTPPTSNLEFYGNDYPFVKIPDMTESVHITKTETKISKKGAEYLGKAKLPKDSIMVSCIATVGNVGITSEESFTNQQINSLIPDSNIADFKYLYYFFKANKSYLESLGGGGSVYTNISKSKFENMEVVIPPVIEQKKISEILSSLDDKIELNRKINANLEKLAAALFKKWFVDIGDELPEGWKKGSIRDVCIFNPPYKIWKGKISKYVEMKDLPENGSSIRKSVVRPFTSGSKFINGDTLLARITPCLENGKTGFVDFLDDSEIAWGSTEFIVMHPAKEEYSEFLYILARLNNFREHAIQSMSGTSGRQRVQISSLENYELAIPDAKTISRFHSVVSDLFAQIKFNNNQFTMLIQIRDSLLPRLMNGKIRVKI